MGFTLINWNFERVSYLLINWYVVLCVFFSILLFLFDYFLFESEARFNDMVRILLYSFYFTWTFLLFLDVTQLNKWFKNLAFWSIVILIFQGLFEYYQPYLWTFMLSSNVEKRTVGRIAGSLIDSNSYSCSMILFFIIFFKEEAKKLSRLRKGYLFILFLVVVLFNELSGSRQGFLLIVLFLVYLFFENLSKQNLKRMFIAIGVMIFLTVVFNQQIFDYSEANPHSALGRFLNSSDGKANQSNIDRQNSIYQGILFLSDNYFIIGPGMLNFASRWSQYTNAHEPHIGFLFLLVQYGVFTLAIFYVFYLSFLRAKAIGFTLIFSSLFIHLMLQPNSVYYAITFFVIFYIDIRYLKIQIINR